MRPPVCGLAMHTLHLSPLFQVHGFHPGGLEHTYGNLCAINRSLLRTSYHARLRSAVLPATTAGP